VFCCDDRRPVGRLDGWHISPERGLELLVRSGRWDPVVRRVPCSDVLWRSSNAILLSLERRRFLELPRYLPDEELQLAVYESLRTFSPLRYTSLRYTPVRSIEIRAHDGVVGLSGHVANELHRRESVWRAGDTPGVLRVQDRLVTDEQVTNAVAKAMLPHPELQPSRVRVSGKLGEVLLEGALDSPRDVGLAISVAAEVPGVTAVESRLFADRQQDAGSAG
jgi:hypothetical protein